MTWTGNCLRGHEASGGFSGRRGCWVGERSRSPARETRLCKVREVYGLAHVEPERPNFIHLRSFPVQVDKKTGAMLELWIVWSRGHGLLCPIQRFCGASSFGQNKVQSLSSKWNLLPSNAPLRCGRLPITCICHCGRISLCCALWLDCSLTPLCTYQVISQVNLIATFLPLCIFYSSCISHSEKAYSSKDIFPLKLLYCP